MIEQGDQIFERHSDDGQAALDYERIVCANPDCGKSTFTATYSRVEYNSLSHKWVRVQKIGRGTVRFHPESAARNFPSYVPQAVRDDYNEACLIVDLSPKASATLSRRAIQGIMRHFWEATGSTLWEELKSVEAKMHPRTWKSIKAAKDIGNIGAHMERDINLIIDVDPGEAELMIQLVEALIDDTYIADHEQMERHDALVDAAAAKARAKSGSPTPVLAQMSAAKVLTPKAEPKS